MHACPSSSPWQQTVVALKAISNRDSASRGTVSPSIQRIDRTREQDNVVPMRAVGRVVRVTDRCSAHTATIEWCDSTSCRYGHQTWRVGIAKRAGICAMSGNFIRRGDPVYRPWGNRPVPQNAHEMILARLVDQVQWGEIA